jgi:hypothetical protein
MHYLMDERDFLSQKMAGKRLFPYAKDLWYRPDIEVLGMTLEIYDDNHTYEYRMAFEVDEKLEHFLSLLEEVE